MLDHPKFVAKILDAEKLPQKFKQYQIYIKLNRKGIWGVFERRTEGSKFHELEILNPCIIPQFLKMVWVFLATTKV